jgi:hypothetical protein
MLNEKGFIPEVFECLEVPSDGTLRPYIHLSMLSRRLRHLLTEAKELQTMTVEECRGLILTRGYHCRRPFSYLPLAFDLLAHSAELFDAYTPEQAEQMRKEQGLKLKPEAQIMLERFGDRKNLETGEMQPHIGEKNL